MSIVSRRGLLKVMVISLVIVFGLGVLFGTAQAEDRYRLAELINMGADGFISAGTLTFSNFGLTSIGPTPANPAGFFVEVVGVDTPQPVLKLLANNQLAATGAHATGQITNFWFTVKDSNRSIQGKSLLLVLSSAASGNYTVKVDEETTGADVDNKTTVSRTVPPNPDLPDKLLAEEDFSVPQEDLSITTNIGIFANPVVDELGQVAIRALEWRFKLAPTRADAGPDQVVQASVMLDGSSSEGNGLTYEWRLIPRDPSLEEITPEPGMNPILEVKGLAKGLYDVTLSVTDENDLVDTDTMLLAAAGPCESDSNKLAVNNDLHLWRFKIKKYKYCNWAFARVYGTVNAFNLPLDSSIDENELEAKVILQVVDQDGKAVGEWSAKTEVEIKDRRYKYVIRNKW